MRRCGPFATALEDSQFLVIGRHRFLQIIEQDSDLAGKLMWQLLQKLSRLVRASNEKLVAETASLDDLEVEEVEGPFDS
jgi:CRP-like cAMP-binding protein